MDIQLKNQLKLMRTTILFHSIIHFTPAGNMLSSIKQYKNSALISISWGKLNEHLALSTHKALIKTFSVGGVLF